MVAVCDVQRQHAERARQEFGGKADIYEDYRKLLERKDIEAVTIGTPDHWHTKIAIEALQAGKHVFCEKPFTFSKAEAETAANAVRKEIGRAHV